MKKLKTTIPFFSLNDLKHFKEVRFEEKSIYWEQAGKEKPNVFPVRLTLDNILLSIILEHMFPRFWVLTF